MSVVTLLAASEAQVALPVPAFIFGLVGVVVFVALAVVTFSYRDVAHRQGQKSSGAAPSQHGHGH